MKKTFKIYTLGCKVNQYDSSDLSSRLMALKMIKKTNDADYALINSCSVTKAAIHKCKRMINKAKKENPGAKIILFGCYPKAYAKEAKKISADLIFKTNEANKIVKAVTGKARTKNFLVKESGRSRYFIKIQDGCEQFCSYCIIPYTRGKITSRDEKEIIKEIEEAIKKGFAEIVLCGIHLGLYGKDFKKTKKQTMINLEMLLKKIVKLKNLGRIRLSSIEINEVKDNLVKLMATKKLCRHLHIPLQSGSDKILKLMNRPYAKKYFKKRIKAIRKIIPEIAITTDVIVGFPGETKADFKETLEFIKNIKFSKLHIFPFSEHKKTPAAKFAGRVEQGEMEKRAKKLRSLGKKLEKEYVSKFKKQNLLIVVEKKIGRKYFGKTEYYFDVLTNNCPPKNNQKI